MGHLINPIAFRLGWSKHWVDEFFIDLRFYPELFHRLLRFRYFLNCFFGATIYSSNYFDDYLVSHFSFQLNSRGFLLSIYFYNSRMDSCWYNFFEKISQKNFGSRFFPKNPGESPAFSSWNRKCLSLLFFLYHYSVNGVLDETYFYRLPFFKVFETSLQASDFSFFYKKFRKLVFSSLSPSEQECFVLLYFLRFYSLQEIGRFSSIFRGQGLRLLNYEYVAQNFFRLLFMSHITRPFMNMFMLWLKFLGSYFFFEQPFTIIFFQVSNEQISARFLARFLAIRFSQGFSVRSILTPIRKDLRLAKRFARRLHLKERLLNQQNEILRDESYSLLTKFLGFCTTFYQNSFFSKASLWSFDHFFLTYQLIFASFFKEYVFSFYEFSRLFFEKKLFYSLILRFSSEAKKLFFFYQNSTSFFLELLSEYHLNYENSCSLIALGSVFSFRGLSSASLLFLTGAVLLDFLKFSLNQGSISRNTDSFFNVKRRTFRSFSVPAQGLQGFRIRLHGRFTRKQIASAFHFQEGSLPLSSLKASIDYGFSTVPLRNSAIGIKVWLYRQDSSSLPSYEYAFTFL